MKKLKLYIESSAISNLEQSNMPEAMADMKALWEMIKQGGYEVVISSVTIDELSDIKDINKRERIFELIDQIRYEFIDYKNVSDSIVKTIIQSGILTENHMRDCEHIACAITKICDCIVTYNMNDMHKISTIKGVRPLSLLYGGTSMDIVKADSLLPKGADK